MADYQKVDLSKLNIPFAVIELLPEIIARENNVMAISLENNILTLAIHEPPGQEFIDKIEFVFNRKIKFVLADKEQLVEMIDKYYKQMPIDSVES